MIGSKKKPKEGFKFYAFERNTRKKEVENETLTTCTAVHNN